MIWFRLFSNRETSESAMIRQADELEVHQIEL